MKKFLFLAFLCLATLVSQAADKVVVLATVADMPTFCAKGVDFAEFVGEDSIKGGAYALKIFTEQPAFTDAWDVTRPVGLVGILPEKADDLMGVLALPLKNMDAVNRMVSKDLKTEEVGEETWKVTSEYGEFYARKLGNWLLLSDKAANLRPNVDGAALEKMTLEQAKTCAVGVSLWVNEIPQNQRERMLNEVLAKVRGWLRDGHAEGAPAFVKALEALLDKIQEKAQKANYVFPVDRVALKVDWDKDAHALSLRLEATAPAGSKAANDMMAFAKVQNSALGSFADKDAMFSSVSAMTLPTLGKTWVKDLHEAFLKDQITMMKKGPKPMDKAEAFLNKYAELWRNSFLSPYINEGLNLTLTGDDALLFWGRTVPDGYALEEPFKQIVKYAKENKADECEKSVLSATDRVEGDWHVYEAVLSSEKGCPLPSLKDGRPVCLVFAPKAIYFAIGNNAPTRLMAYLKSDQAKAAEVPAYQARLSVAKLIKAIETYSSCEKYQKKMAEFQKKNKNLAQSTLTLTVLPITNGAALELKLFNEK